MRVDELRGYRLDYWVARAEGLEKGRTNYVAYSTDWSQGGPIIEREDISVEKTDKNPAKWMAIKPHQTSNFREDYSYGHGSTYLEAAMRCYVKSKFGEEVSE